MGTPLTAKVARLEGEFREAHEDARGHQEHAATEVQVSLRSAAQTLADEAETRAAALADEIRSERSATASSKAAAAAQADTRARRALVDAGAEARRWSPPLQTDHESESATNSWRSPRRSDRRSCNASSRADVPNSSQRVMDVGVVGAVVTRRPPPTSPKALLPIAVVVVATAQNARLTSRIV